MGIGDILNERGERYGEFSELADLSQCLKEAMAGGSRDWYGMDADQKEALEMICHKIARILNGDPNYPDSWLDIAGYAKLVADRLAEDAPVETNYGTEEDPISRKKVKKAFRTLMRAGILSEH